MAEVSELASGIAMHGAGLKPLYLDRTSVPEAALLRERQLLSEQASGSGKADAVVAKVGTVWVGMGSGGHDECGMFCKWC